MRAAGNARAWIASGFSFHTRRTLPGYSASTWSKTETKPRETGHWNSANSTTVSGASAGPAAGESPRGTRYRTTPFGGAVGAALAICVGLVLGSGAGAAEGPASALAVGAVT